MQPQPKEMQPEELLTFGPVQLNAATAELESIVSDLLQGAQAQCNYSDCFGLEMEINGVQHNISLLLERANFGQFRLEASDTEKYDEILKNSTIKLFKTSADITRDSVEAKQAKNAGLESLTYGEAQAINIYTGAAYSEINGFLRCDFASLGRNTTQKALNEHGTQLLLASMLAMSGLNSVSKTVPMHEDSISIRGDRDHLPVTVVQARINAIKAYEQKNYGHSTTDTVGFLSTTEIIPTYQIIKDENEPIGERNTIGFYVASDYILVKTKNNDPIKISSPDPLYDMIKNIHNANPPHDFTVHEKSLVINDPRLSSLINFDGGFHKSYKTIFTNLVGKNVSEISQNAHENEVLMPPVAIQWVGFETVGDKTFFIGHPIDAPEIQKDTLIIRGYNAFKSIQTAINSLNKVKKDLIDTYSNILETSASKVINECGARLYEAELVVKNINNTNDLQANINEVLTRAENIKEISKILMVYQFISELNALGSLPSDIKIKVSELLQNPEITSENLISLSDIIKQEILIANEETATVLNVALEKLHKIEPKIIPQLYDEFDKIAKTYLTTKCSEQDYSYVEPNSKSEGNPIYRLEHGGMHAARAALNSSKLVDLLKITNYPEAQKLNDKDKYLIAVAVMFHDAGREQDRGDDKKEWEKKGAELCAQYLRARGFGEGDIAKVQDAIIHKSDKATQASNIYALIVAASDSLDWVRSPESDFDIRRLPDILKIYVPDNILQKLAESCKQAAAIQGDSPHAQFNIKENFSIEKKKEYEHSDQCFSKTSEVYETCFEDYKKLCQELAKRNSKLPDVDMPISSTKHNVSFSIMQKLNDSTKTKYLVSTNAKQAYEKGYFTPAELANLEVDKIKVLISSWAIAVYRIDVKFADLKDLEVNKIKVLISNEAIAAYRAGVEFADLKDLKIEKIKALISSYALEAYKEKYVKFAELKNLDTSKIKVLTSPGAIVAYNAGTKFNDLKDLETDSIKEIISYRAIAVYNADVRSDEFKNLEVDQIEALASSGALKAYAEKYVTFAELKDLKVDKIEALISDDALKAYAEKYVTFDKLKDLEIEKIKALISDKAISVYVDGSGVTFDQLKDLEVDQIKALIKVLTSFGVSAAYDAGVTFSNFDLKNLKIDKIKALISNDAIKVYKAGITFDKLKDLEIEKIKVLTSSGAIAVYNFGVIFDKLKDLKVEQIKALTSNKVISNYNYVGGKFADLVLEDFDPAMIKAFTQASNSEINKTQEVASEKSTGQPAWVNKNADKPNKPEENTDDSKTDSATCE